MNHIIAAVILGLAGFSVGLLTPMAADKIIFYKCSRKDTKYIYDTRFTSRFVLTVVCLVNTLAWSLAGLKMENTLAALFLAILFAASVLIAVIDLRIYIIPNELVLFVLVTGILFQIQYFGFRSLLTACSAMFAMIMLFTVAAGIAGAGKVGAGDIKLAGAMGLVLGYPNIMTALIVMSAALVLYSVIGLITRKLTLHSMFAFAPFMMSGMAFSLVYILFKP